MAAPATTSHTSLPSQTGPMVLIATRRSTSVRPTILCSAPTPKSKPSRTKNPVQKKATMTNQTIERVIYRTSVGQRRHGGTGLLGVGGGRRQVRLVGQAASGVPDHQDGGDHPDRAVQHDHQP